MLTKVNKAVLNQALLEREHSIYLFGMQESLPSIWDHYENLMSKNKADKKMINLQSFMEIQGVHGAYWDVKKGKLLLKTDLGDKIYITGRVTLDTIVKKVEKFLKKI